MSEGGEIGAMELCETLNILYVKEFSWFVVLLLLFLALGNYRWRKIETGTIERIRTARDKNKNFYHYFYQICN